MNRKKYSGLDNEEEAINKLKNDQRILNTNAKGPKQN
jgi:hypothetical protein